MCFVRVCMYVCMHVCVCVERENERTLHLVLQSLGMKSEVETKMEVQGRIAEIRGFRRICFVDLVLENHKVIKLVELIFKKNDGDTLVENVKRDLNVGDEIKVFGSYDEGDKTRDHDIVLCSRFEVIRKWPRDRTYEPPLQYLSEDSKKNKPCKFFTSSRKCPKGSKCRYAHITNGKERYEWTVERRRLRMERGTMEGDTLSIHDKKGKNERASVFAKFLIKTFGKSDVLSKGSGVLDVAGGRGEMNFELNVLRNVRCTTIDPRPSKLSKRQLRWLKKRNRNTKHEETHSQLLNRMTHIQALFNPSFAKCKSDLVNNCTLIIGMHPDEATEEIVDMALFLKKPFAVVPCCVFPKSGEKMSCKKWHEYLKSKSPHIHEAYLNFVGRNHVLYCEEFD